MNSGNVDERGEAERERIALLGGERAARRQAEEAQKRFEFLAEASNVLASSLDYETTLASVAELAVPHVADWCTIHILQDDGSVRQIAVAHVDPAKVRWARELEQRYPYDPSAPSGVPNVLRTGRSELTAHISDEMLVASAVDERALRILRELGLSAAMTVPLRARGRTLGAMTFVSAESAHKYDATELALAEDLARRAAMAVDNSRLHREAQQAAAIRAAILAQITDGLAIADTSGQISFINAAGRQILGIPDTAGAIVTEELMTWSRDGERRAFAQSPLSRAVVQGETVINDDVHLQRTEGDTILEVSAAPVIAADGTRLGGVATFRDVTTQRDLERQKDDFLSAAAHDLKTPLTTIKGLAQILHRRAARAHTPETDKLLDGLQRIDTTSTRMAGLINELLDVARIHAGEPLDLIQEPIDLVALVKSLVDEQQQTTEQHTLRMDVPTTELIGLYDRSRLERALINILSNAITYSPQGGNVWVGLAVSDDKSHAVLHVQDEGLGIPAADVPRVFERFHRASNVAGAIPGTGIGLAGAQQIIEDHGGTIDVRSEEGRGTTFTVCLPLYHRALAENEALASGD